MNFKNIVPLKLKDEWQFTAEDLCAKLKPFQPCGSSDFKSMGWVSPHDGALAYSVNGQILLSLRTEEKVLPPAVVKKEVSKRERAIEAQQGSRPGRKQRAEIKDAVIAELLPRAFTKEDHTTIWIDPKNRLFVVGGGLRQVDVVIEQLRLSLDDVPLILIQTSNSPSFSMTSWLVNGDAPEGFTIDKDCELRSQGEESASVKYSNESLDGNEIHRHVAIGKAASSLAMTYNERVSFVLTKAFEIKRICMLDTVMEDAAANDNDAGAFDADVTIMTGELSSMIPALVTALGGEVA